MYNTSTLYTSAIVSHVHPAQHNTAESIPLYFSGCSQQNKKKKKTVDIHYFSNIFKLKEDYYRFSLNKSKNINTFECPLLGHLVIGCDLTSQKKSKNLWKLWNLVQFSLPWSKKKNLRCFCVSGSLTIILWMCYMLLIKENIFLKVIVKCYW